jgi:predicted ribosome quality control (RQC) complex YloA/Tae2 family protein
VIRHPLTLERIAEELNDVLSNTTLFRAWSNESGSLHLLFHDEGRAFTVSISTDPHYGTVLLGDAIVPPGKNVLHLLPALIGQQCHAVTKVENDRIVTFHFASHTLHALLFTGNRANIVVTEGMVIIDALRNSKELTGSVLTIDERPPVLGKHYTLLEGDFDDVIARIRASTEYVLLEKDENVLFSLVELPGWTVRERSDDLFALLRRTVGLRRHRDRLHRLKADALKLLQREKHRLERMIDNMTSDEATADHAAHARHLADLLMSHSSPTSTGLETIVVSDWEGGEVTITLNPLRSIVENATMYYEKAKRSERAAEHRAIRLPAVKVRLQSVLQEIRDVEATTDVKDLQRYMKNTDLGPTPTSPYRVFVLDEDYTLYVGKNAANNDQLTMRFAKQNDWWFHARGSSGSHCVLRGPASGKPPKNILEQAAAIAAYYSGSRNASWTPVVYTQRKYVRKPKGANVGAVRLEREDVIMVKPAIPTSGSAEDESDR